MDSNDCYSDTMKVWIFNHYTKPPHIIDSHRHSCFAKELLKRGHDVNVFFASTYQKGTKNLLEGRDTFLMEEIEGINYIAIKARRYHGNGISRLLNMLDYYFGLFKVFKKVINKTGIPDVIYASSVHPLTLVAGIKIARRLKIPVVCEVRDLWPLTLIELGNLNNKSILARLLFRGEKWIYENADRIIFTMKGGKDYIVDQGWEKDIDLTKIFHINNGVNLELFRYNLEMFHIDDPDLLDENTFKVIYTGSIGHVNSVETIVRAAKVLREKRDIKFLIYGEGLEKPSLQEYVIMNNMNNVIIKNRVDKKYIPYILTKCDLNIIVGRDTKLYKYGISLNKMFDYFASGKPTISNLKCSYDLLHLYECGKTLDDNTPESLAKGVLEFYDMKSNMYQRYCDNALKAAEDHDYTVLGEKLERVLLDACLWHENHP